MAATFTGKVIDENNEPFAFANVVLLNPGDSTYIAGATTGLDGSFSIDCSCQSPVVKFSYIGYETKYINASGTSLGTVQLKPEATMLGEVVVKGTRPTFKLTTEGLKTDVDGTLLSRVGSASDVLGNLPGVQKKDKDIEVFGKGTPLIYVNGRELRNKSELEMIKSDDIASVELITNPGAKYKADVESVILIKTKRPQGEGFSFDAEANYYQGKNMDLATGINWNYRKGGMDVFGAVWYNDDRWENNDLIKFDVQADTTWLLDQHLRDKSHSQALYSSVGVNYVLGDNHSMGMRYDTKWYFKSKGHGTMIADVIADGQFYDHVENTADYHSTYNMPHTLNAYYNGKIGKTSIDVNVDYMFSKDRKYQYNNEVSQEQDSRIVTAQSMARSQLLAGKLVLSWPVLGGNLQAGTELSNTRRNDEYLNLEQIVPSSCNEQRENNYAFFVEYSRPLPFGSMRLGLRNENVSSDYYSMGELVPEQSRTYHHLFPTVGLQARAGAVQLMLNYSMKIQRPYYWQLTSSVTYANRFTWESGNPTLKPSINNQLGLMVMWRWMSLMAEYKHVSDHIINVAHEVPGSEAMIKDWTRIPTPVGTISPKNPLFIIQFNNNIKILPTLTANASLDITTRGDMENVSLTRALFNLYLSLTKTFLNDRLSVKIAGRNLLDAQEKVQLRYGLRNMCQAQHRDSRELQVTVRYKFNAASSKWRGSGAGSDEKARLGK